MLFPEEDAPLLKAWIVKRIERTSDADAEVLAEYIIALLKHDGTKDEVRKLCEAEIPDFLTEDPTAFLDEVFQAIVYRSYVPGAAAPPPSSASVPPALKSAAEVYGPQSQDNGAQGVNGTGNGYDGVNGWAGNGPPSGPRKRRYRDLDAPGGQEGAQHMGGSRPIKNPRQQGRGRGQMPDGFAEQGQQHQHGPVPPNGYFPQDWSPQNMEAFMGGMGSLGMPFPGMPMPQFDGNGRGGRGGRGGRQRRRGRCRDFDNKGFCERGSTCMFDHGNDGQAEFMPPMGHTGGDPDNAMMTLSNPNLQAMPYGMLPQNANRGRGDRRGGRGGKKGKARAPFSAEGPVNDRSKSTIVVENIPEEHFSEEEVRGFFSQFGPLVEVSMQPYKHLAIVKYEKWGSANAAYRSPKVIFDNRFVRVFWYKDEMEGEGLPASIPNGSMFSGGDRQGDVEMDAAEPEIDPEEFQRRQEEAQKQHQEREAKRTELEQQRQELDKKQQALMEKHREETRKLQEKLLEKNGGTNTGTTNENGTSSGTDMLRAKLAALEQEAKILGLDPDGGDDGSASYSSSYRGGGYRGRGGRGRGGRGGSSFRSVDNRHAAYAQYTIDNRPKKLALSGVDFTIPQKDESLRHFLLHLGEFESVDPTPSTTYVSFRDRKTAERMYYSLNGKELPGVDGKLDLQWVNTPLPPVTPSSGPKTTTATNNNTHDSNTGAATTENTFSEKNGGDENMDEEEGEIGEDSEAQHNGAGENEYIEQRVEDDDAY